VLSLGVMPLANALIPPEDVDAAEPRYPLDVVLCPACALVQITETVPPEQLFGEYLYFTSYSDTMVRHAAALVDRLVGERNLNPSSLVVEIGSNDGYLLRQMLARGVPVLGIEPARNVAAVAALRGVRTLPAFFGAALAEEVRAGGEAADAVIANNVLAHVADPNGVVRGMRTLLRDQGVVVVEVPYIRDMLDRCEYDTIYHEHLCYFSATALQALFARHDLAIVDVERLRIHGGSLRVFASPAGAVPSAEARGRVESLLASEQAWGVRSLEAYAAFGAAVRANREALRSLVAGLRASSSRVAGYGAAAKATVLLNYCGLDASMVDFVADRSPYKQGRYIPGVRVPICAPERLLEAMPEYALLLAWNVADEILAQQTEYRRRGGRFILPIPTVAVL
jgi:SAM-dependent methyltransferase